MKKYLLIAGGVSTAITIIIAVYYFSTRNFVPLPSDTESNQVFAVSDTIDVLKVGSKVSALDRADADSFLIIYEYTYTNSGDGIIYDLNSQSDLLSSFGSLNFQVVSLSSDVFTTSNSYNGSNDKSLLTGENQLLPGQTARVFLTVKLWHEGNSGPFSNSITASGQLQPVTNSGSNNDSNQDNQTDSESEQQEQEVDTPTLTPQITKETDEVGEVTPQPTTADNEVPLPTNKQTDNGNANKEHNKTDTGSDSGNVSTVEGSAETLFTIEIEAQDSPPENVPLQPKTGNSTPVIKQAELIQTGQPFSWIGINLFLITISVLLLNYPYVQKFVGFKKD